MAGARVCTATNGDAPQPKTWLHAVSISHLQPCTYTRTNVSPSYHREASRPTSPHFPLPLLIIVQLSIPNGFVDLLQMLMTAGELERLSVLQATGGCQNQLRVSPR